MRWRRSARPAWPKRPDSFSSACPTTVKSAALSRRPISKPGPANDGLAWRAKAARLVSRAGRSLAASSRDAKPSFAGPGFEIGLLESAALLTVVGQAHEKLSGLFGQAGLALRLQRIPQKLIYALTGGCLPFRPVDLRH